MCLRIHLLDYIPPADFPYNHRMNPSPIFMLKQIAGSYVCGPIFIAFFHFSPVIDVRVKRELEDTESVGFRHQFKGWDNVLNIDYSKSIDTVSNKELQVKADRPKTAADMSGNRVYILCIHIHLLN